MSVYAILNLLNKLEKEIIRETCRTFYLLFCSEFNTFNKISIKSLE